jgi:hypothetical protein
MNRREFLTALGVAAAAVSVNGIPVPELEAAAAAPAAASYLDGAFQVGDVITFAGRYAVNPVTREATGHLQQFVVTAVVENGVNLVPDVGGPYALNTISPVLVGDAYGKPAVAKGSRADGWWESD